MADWTAVGLEPPAGMLAIEDSVELLRALSTGTRLDVEQAEAAMVSAAWLVRNGDPAIWSAMDLLLRETQRSMVPEFLVAKAIILASRAIRLDQYETVLEQSGIGRAIALEHGMEMEAGICCGLAGTASYRTGNYDTARINYEESLVAARRTHSLPREAAALSDIGLVLKNQGQLHAAEQSLRRAYELYRQIGSPGHTSRCALNLALVLMRTSCFSEAEVLLRGAEAVFDEMHARAFLTSTRLALGRVLRLKGSYAESRVLLQGVLALAIESESPRDIVLAQEFLGDTLIDEGETTAALSLYEAARIRADLSGSANDLVVETHRRVAEALCHLGQEPDRQIASARLSVRIAREQGDLYELLQSQYVLGGVLALANEFESARRELHAAFHLADRIGATLEHGLIAHRLSILESKAGRAGEALDLSVIARRQTAISPEANAARAAELLYRGLVGASAGPEMPILEAASDAPIESLSPVSELISTNMPMIADLHTCIKLAVHNINILVLGESGTGKELVAQAIHKESARKGPFVPVNCSAFPGDLLEGELFGHARGAYTGADRERSGLIEFAHHGTLFLDEIGDMPLKAQARLLRALESGEVRRLGENSPRVVDVRVVAATHRDLLQMVSSGEFRLDLYYRLAGYVLDLPPVREREGDARLLVDHFLHEICAEQDKQVGLSPEVKQQLAAYSWPGNVREIRNVIHRLVSISEHGRTVRHLPFDLDGAPRARTLPEALEVEERKRIIDALRAHDWNKTRAAAALGSSRTTLIGKMRRLGIEPPPREGKAR